jgi:hypothetical protein
MAISKKFFVDIDLQGNGLNNATIGANASMTKGGSFRYNTETHRLEYYNETSVEEVANLGDISAVTGGLIFQTGYDAATNTPDIADGNALKGYFWVVTVAGTFLGESVQVGDSIIAKVDNAGATIADWLILQGNVVVATETVDGIVRLGTQTEVNDGTEGGAVVVTPATLQGKIDAQITPAINNKLPLAGGTMSGDIDMNSNNIFNANAIRTDEVSNHAGEIGFTWDGGNLNLNGISKITGLTDAPTLGTDAANKTYVDGAAATAESNANDYTDTGLAAKLDLAGGTMSGNINMDGNYIGGASIIGTTDLQTDKLSINDGPDIELANNLDAKNLSTIINLPAPTNGGDAANKTYVDDTALAAADTAQENAEAFAASLAPNYDPAGSAVTALATAQDYTDTEIAAQSYTAVIATGDWSGTAGNYSYTVTHNLIKPYVFTAIDNESGEIVEVSCVRENAVSSTVYLNNIPTGDLFVSFVKAGGNL